MGGASSSKKDPAPVILLLGPGGCGKSTIRKQMVCSSRGFKDEERKKYAEEIRKSVVRVQQWCSHILSDEVINDLSDEVAESVDAISSARSIEIASETTNRDLFQNLKKVWSAPELAASWASLRETSNEETRMEFRNCAYFLEDKKFSQLLDPDYAPTNEDIFRCRTVTKSVGDMRIKLDPSKGQKDKLQIPKEILMRDVGGQTHLQNDWQPALLGVTAVVFIVALDSYQYKDQEGRCELLKTLELATSFFTNGEAKKLPCIFLFNKIDLFRESFAKNFKTTLIEGFQSTSTSCDGCMEELESWFVSEVHKKRGGKLLERHRTCALDSELTESVLYKLISSMARAQLAGANLI